MIRDEQGEIVAGVRYRLVLLGDTMESFGDGQAEECIRRAQGIPGATVLAQCYTVKPHSHGVLENESPWVKVYPVCRDTD